MRYVELFAGGGGLSLGLDRAGWQCVAHAEIEPHARAILRQHWPDTPLFGDVSQIDGTQWRGLVDVISGGSPCQDMSVAGKRAGLEGARSSLFHQQVRIWQESNAPYLLWENVPGAFSSNNGYDFAAVLSTLVGRDLVADGAVRPDKHGKLKWLRAGRAVGPQSVAAWRVLDLQYFGPPQRRARIFVVAARSGARDPREILLEREGVCRHPAPSRQARQGVTGTLNARVKGGGGLGTDFELGGGVVAIPLQEVGKRTGVSTTDTRCGVGIAADGDPMYTLQAGAQHGVIAFHHTQNPIHGAVSPAIGRPTDGMGVVQCATGDVTHTLTHEGADASEDGTGRGTPIVATSDLYIDPGMESWKASEVLAPICARDSKDAAALVLPHGGVTPTLSMGAHTAGPGSNGQDALQFAAITAAVAGRPRRLTPRETERLMGWGETFEVRGIDGLTISCAIQGAYEKAVDKNHPTWPLRDVWARIKDRATPPRPDERSDYSPDSVPTLPCEGSRRQGRLGAGTEPRSACDLFSVRVFVSTEEAHALNRVFGPELSQGNGCPVGSEEVVAELSGWTKRGVREDGTVYTLSDTARYRIVGNGVGSPCAEWIARGFA